MAAGDYKATVKLNRISGLPADAVVNDFFFHWDNGAADPVLADFDIPADAIEQFYNTVPTAATRQVAAYLSEVLDRTNPQAITFYKVPAVRGVLGAPVASDSFVLAASAGGTPLPEECAICLSYRADYGLDVEFGPGKTRPRATHRGRIYLGPIESTVTLLEDGTTHATSIGSTPRTDIVAAAVQSFSAGSAASPLNGTHWTWGQFSPKMWRRQLVTSVWVDDAFDIQRRRGGLALNRTTGAII